MSEAEDDSADIFRDVFWTFQVSGTYQERSGSPYLNLESQWNVAECVVGCHRSLNDDMGVRYSIGTLHGGFHGMVTIPDNIPEVPEVPGFQESAYKGLESMSEPGKLRE